MLAPNIISQTEQQADLAKLARTVRECQETIGRAYENMRIHGGVALDSAMAAGDALILAKAKTDHGKWLKFLRDCGLSDDRAERYMRLARGRAALSNSEHVRNLTMTAALRLLKPAAAPKKRAKPTKAAPELNPLAWSLATLAQRQQFLDAIGQKSFLEAMPPTWRTEMGKAEPASPSLSDHKLLH